MIDPQHPSSAAPPSPPPTPTAAGLIRAPGDFWAGMALLGFVAFVFWVLRALPQGTLREFGPAMLPRVLAAGIALCALGLIASAFVSDGAGLPRFPVRAPLMVLAGILAFALTIRPFGLLVAGPLAMVIGGFGSTETRWREILPFAAIITGFCAGLFRYALRLPIPILNLPGIIQL